MNNISFRRHPYHLCRFARVVGILNALPIPGKNLFPASAATQLTVTTPNDNTLNDGYCSLRKAI